MRVTVKRDEFAGLLTGLSKVVESRSTIPIISSVMLNAEGGRLLATATDLDIEIRDSIEAEIDEPGKLCVDAKLLTDIVKRAAPSGVSLETKGGQLVVKSGRSRFKLNVLPAEDFPSFQSGEFDAGFETDLASLVGPVQFAMSNEEARYYLNGVYVCQEDGQLVAVATDGHRLAEHRQDGCSEFAAAILPRKFVGLIPKGTLAVSISQSKVCVSSGALTITSKLIDGTFPDYKRVIPQNNDKVVSFDRDALLKGADRVAVVSSEKGRAVRLDITEGNIDLLVRGDGEARDSVETEYAGEPVTVGFNAAYLRDMLTVLPSVPVELVLADGGSPALLRCVGMANWMGVLMPMRV